MDGTTDDSQHDVDAARLNDEVARSHERAAAAMPSPHRMLHQRVAEDHREKARAARHEDAANKIRRQHDDHESS